MSFHNYNKERSIIYDKVQHRVNIPKRFVDLLKIDLKKDRFEFTLVTETDGDGKYNRRLVGRLKRD